MVVEQQLERARLELLDMGLRSNPQLNYRSGSKALDIIDEQSAKIFTMLVEQENTLSFLPLPETYQLKIAESPIFNLDKRNIFYNVTLIS
jgi:hypothetical protein